MPAPHLVLSGYFGFGNTGDEALLEAMVGSLRKREPAVRLTALIQDPRYCRHLELETVPRKDLRAVTRVLRSSDLLISGPGGLVQDSTGVGSVAYYLGITSLARFLGKPAMFYGQGFGPVRTRAGKLLVRLLANRLSLITVRDEESARDMQALGVTRPPIRVTADPALTLEPPPPARMAELLQQAGLQGEVARLEGPTGRQPGVGPLVAVTVRPWPSLRMDELAEGLRRFAEAEGARYLLIPFHPELDETPSRELATRIGARLLEGEWAPAELAGLLRCTDMIVGMRLHSLILAVGAGVPCLGLAYDPKVERFARRAGAVPLLLEELSAERLATALGHLLAGRSHARSQIRARVAPMVERAERTAAAALGLARGQTMGQVLADLDRDNVYAATGS